MPIEAYRTESAMDKNQNGVSKPPASANGNILLKEPLKLKGVLDEFKSFDVTPVIGREFPDVKLVDWLNATNSDELLRDLAITSRLLRSMFECLRIHKILSGS